MDAFAAQLGARCLCLGLVVMALGAYSSPTYSDEDTLAGAFIAQCKHMQSCVREKLAARSDMDPAMAQMIESRMEGQCEMQVARIEPYEGMPQAEKMKRCYRATTQLSCAELEDEPEIPECDF